MSIDWFSLHISYSLTKPYTIDLYSRMNQVTAVDIECLTVCVVIIRRHISQCKCFIKQPAFIFFYFLKTKVYFFIKTWRTRLLPLEYVELTFTNTVWIHWTTDTCQHAWPWHAVYSPSIGLTWICQHESPPSHHQRLSDGIEVSRCSKQARREMFLCQRIISTGNWVPMLPGSHYLPSAG